MSKYYDLYVFTAATKEYAEAVIEKLNFGKKLIQDYLCRDHCF
jgi:TFIIF-interacting CTD phosphatase-like protein